MSLVTRHFLERASQRGLRPHVLDFILVFGVGTHAAGATSWTVLEHALPADLRGTELARRARDWIVVETDEGWLLTCYRRTNAGRFLREKSAYRRRRLPQAA
jgi:hypothetical protein